jgi:hypothetical protein
MLLRRATRRSFRRSEPPIMSGFSFPSTPSFEEVEVRFLRGCRLARTFTFAAEGATVDRPSLAIRAFRHMTGHSYQRVPADRLSCRSRNLDTAFRSLATTLSPPLRGQRSWPVPSIPHRRLPRTRSIQNSSAPFGFEAEPGRCQRPAPVSRVHLQRSRSFPRSPLPLRSSLENPLDQSVQPVPVREARLT